MEEIRCLLGQVNALFNVVDEIYLSPRVGSVDVGEFDGTSGVAAIEKDRETG